MISAAVMFLFEGEFGSILHTGDCRLTSDCVQNLPLKYIAKKGKENVCRLDFVFLDCTFSKCFLKLPSKESAIQQVFLCTAEAKCACCYLRQQGQSPLRNDLVIAGYSLHMEASACTFHLSCLWSSWPRRDPSWGVEDIWIKHLCWRGKELGLF